MINARKLLFSATVCIAACAAAVADEMFDESVKNAVARFDGVISENGLQTSVQEILQQAADEGDYLVLLQSAGSWGFSVSGDSPRVIRYFSRRISSPIRCEIATEGAYDGIGLWNLTDDMQVSTSHEEVIVSERVADKYQTRVYPMSGRTVALIIGRTRVNLLMDIIENCAVMNQRMVETEIDITNH